MTGKSGWYHAPGRWKAEATPFWDEKAGNAYDRAQTLGRLVDERGHDMPWATRMFLRMQQVSAHVDSLGFYGGGAAAQLGPDNAAELAVEVLTLGRGKLISSGVKGFVRAARALGQDTVRFSKVYRKLMDLSKGYTGYEHQFDMFPRLRQVDDAVRTLATARNPLHLPAHQAVQQLQKATREALELTERLQKARQSGPPPSPQRPVPVAEPLAPLGTQMVVAPVLRATVQSPYRAPAPPRPFDWTSDAIPPARLQSTFRPDRPGRPGWGLSVERSEPFWKSNPTQRLDWMSRPGDSTIGLLKGWEQRLAEQRAGQQWVDQTRDTWVRDRYRHDPVRLASEQLRWSQPQQSFDPFAGTSALLGQLSDRIQSQQQTRQFLNRVNQQYGFK
jgi:hypothetical protein